ncbi:hypothetical protein [Streptomyces sp. NBC_01497]|uniref:hypothetical protein n=1 Tax=Streptomyces sp. NBC_01497 TaxID=2903885 RepID=UPI002E2F6EA3|nr:hypothetical protein [Streptomyces sp. NBC_01497]
MLLPIGLGALAGAVIGALGVALLWHGRPERPDAPARPAAVTGHVAEERAGSARTCREYGPRAGHARAARHHAGS